MKGMRKSWIILFALLGLLSEMRGQQQPLYSQYMLDKFLVNPAYAGATGMTSINLISRIDYVGFTRPPETFALNIQGRLLEDSYILRALRIRRKTERKSRSGRVGLGASVFTDRNGIISKTGFQGTYAYHVNLKNLWQLSGGLNFLGYQYRIDDQNVPYNDPGDPLIEATDKTFFVADASAGILLSNGKFFTGFSMNDLFGSLIKLDQDVYGNYEMLRKYSLISGYKFSLSSKLALEPSILLQGTRTNWAFDFSTRLSVLDSFWAGLSYRSNKSVVVMLGGRYEMFYLGYAYDINMGLVQTYTSGSHEFILGVRLGENNARRVRWFRQQERNYDF